MATDGDVRRVERNWGQRLVDYVAAAFLWQHGISSDRMLQWKEAVTSESNFGEFETAAWRVFGRNVSRHVARV